MADGYVCLHPLRPVHVFMRELPQRASTVPRGVASLEFSLLKLVLPAFGAAQRRIPHDLARCHVRAVRWV
jgi:hypothetical protein